MHHKLTQGLNICTQNVGELLPYFRCFRGLQHCFVTGQGDSWSDGLVELIVLHSKVSEQEVIAFSQYVYLMPQALTVIVHQKLSCG